MRKKTQILFAVICGILLGVVVACGWHLISDSARHKASAQLDDNYNSSIQLDGSEQATPRPYEEDLIDQLDDEISPLNSMYDLPSFYSQYPDAVGWIYSPGTKIDYGVVQSDISDYFLHRFYDGSYSVGGSIFVDIDNSPDFSDQNTVIYGHNMNDGTKFANLLYYRNSGYYEQHPVMYLNTPEINYRIEIFAGYMTDADSDTYTISFGSDQEFEDYLRRMSAQSDFRTNVSLSSSDHIVTLSTCSYEFYDARYVIQGKLVPIH